MRFEARARLGRDTSASGTWYERIWGVIRTHLGRGTTASAPRHGRTWGGVRYQLRFLCRPLLSLKLVLKISLDCFPLHGFINNSTAIRGVMPIWLRCLSCYRFCCGISVYSASSVCSGAWSIKSMNWSSFGVMIICVLRLRCLPTAESLEATGLYSPRPAAVRRLGSTP